ncbi:MAG: ABC transporter permease [Bacteroidetes bacterium]|nr:ABC transporter permease [Bacteroidota bacterium]
MQTIFFILQKEFKQIFRNRIMLPLLFVMPFIQLIVLPYAADYEIKNINLVIVDNDQSSFSRELTQHFIASDYFILINAPSAYKIGLEDIQTNKADIILEIPNNFEYQLLQEKSASLKTSMNAINAVKAGLAQGYSQSIIQSFNQDIQIKWLPKVTVNQSPTASAPKINFTFSNWYNPTLEYDTFMVPGILVLLITMIGSFLAGLNIVKEKEIGTIEQINVTPIKKHQFIIGKLLPFLFIGLFELSLGLLIGKLIFNIPIVGSLALVYGFAAIYLLLVLGIGLFISTFSDTQQQAMFVTWFFLVLFILMSGLFTPIESMPSWAQSITKFNPIAYFIEVIRMVMLKGSGFYDVRSQFINISIMAIVINVLAVFNYRKTTS